MATINKLQLALEIRLSQKMRSLKGDSPALKRLLVGFGTRLVAEAKQNARNKGVIDTGRLMNSIQYELIQKDNEVGVAVGFFGIEYGTLHEYGVPPVAVPGIRSMSSGSAPNLDEMRKAMFARLREEGKLGQRPSKGIFTAGSFQGRPFLRPAIVKFRKSMKSQLMEFLRRV